MLYHYSAIRSSSRCLSELLIISSSAFYSFLAMSHASGSNEQAGTMVSATPCCCKQLSPRVEGLERQVESLTKENKALVTRLDDVQRQYSKHCLVFNGPGLKSLPGELPTATVCRVARTRWGRNLHPNEMRASHPPRGNKTRIIAEFLDCKELSNFAFMLGNRPNRAGGKIFCDLFLASDNDRKLSVIAKNMKKSGKIRNFRWAASGRLVIVFSDGKSKAYDRAEELESVANGPL